MTPKHVDIPNISVENLETTPVNDGPSLGGFQDAAKDATKETTTSRFGFGKSFIGLGQRQNLVENDDVKKGGSFIFFAPKINNLTLNINQSVTPAAQEPEQKQSILGPKP